VIYLLTKILVKILLVIPVISRISTYKPPLTHSCTLEIVSASVASHLYGVRRIPKQKIPWKRFP